VGCPDCGWGNGSRTVTCAELIGSGERDRRSHHSYRLVNLRYSSKIDGIDEALKALGKTLEVRAI
jgi:hypothetical protein